MVETSFESTVDVALRDVKRSIDDIHSVTAIGNIDEIQCGDDHIILSAGHARVVYALGYIPDEQVFDLHEGDGHSRYGVFDLETLKTIRDREHAKAVLVEVASEMRNTASAREFAEFFTPAERMVFQQRYERAQKHVRMLQAMSDTESLPVRLTEIPWNYRVDGEDLESNLYTVLSHDFQME